MKEDPRIRLIKNIKNRRILYSKSISALNAKGKYIIQLDQDDMFITDDAFNILYNKAEKYNLDLLQFREIPLKFSDTEITKERYRYNPGHDDIRTQPDIKHSYFNGYNFMLWGMLIKAEIYKKTVDIFWKSIINYKIIHLEDYQITFFLVCYAQRFQSINYFFMFHFFHQESTLGKFGVLDLFIFDLLFAANNMIDYHIKDNPEDIKMFINFFPAIGLKLSDCRKLYPEFTKLVLKKFFANPTLSYEEKLASKYYNNSHFLSPSLLS